MVEKEIDIIINEDGTTQAEAIGYHGKGCAEDIAEILDGLGKTTKSRKKKEYYDKQHVRINH